MANIPTNSEIAILMARLVGNWSELMNNFYDIFINPTPMSIVLQLVDENGNTQPITIPNRAMDREYILNGEGSPEGVVSAPVGTLYQDTANGEVYIKQVGNLNVGWFLIIDETYLKTIIKQGLGNPEGVVSADKGTLYIDKGTGVLYIKQGSGNTGWLSIGNTQEILPITALDTAGDIILSDHGAFNIVPTGDVNFLLPNITDTTKLYEIVVQMKLTSTTFNINVGTTHYFNDNEPDFITAGAYNIIYEYDVNEGYWVCGVLGKS